MSTWFWTLALLAGAVAIATSALGRLVPDVSTWNRAWAVLEILAAASWIALAFRVGASA